MDDARRTLERTWRTEAGKIIGTLARMLRDVGLAEEFAQAAFVAALEKWPAAGVPDKPAAWLTTTAKNRALDHLRRETMRSKRHQDLAHEPGGVDQDAGLDELRLMFVACHPVLAPDARVALTLRLLGGLTTAEIARAFLSAEPTIAQRIVRAKKTLAEAKVPFEVPSPEEMPARLSSVLQVIYLVFNEGYAASAGDDWMRPALCDDAIRLGRTLAARMPGEPEAHGLVALMELQASRANARVSSTGEPVLLLDQDRSTWDRARIARGLAALERARALGAPGPYTLQAAIAACHARAAKPDDTDWKQIAALYAALAQVSPSPVVELNRAVAVGMAEGPAAGLALVDAVASQLPGYHLVPSVRADFLAKLGRRDEARAEFERAASMTGNAAERALLLRRAREASES